MSSPTNNRKGRALNQEPLFLPLHQDRYTEGLSTGVIPLAGMKAVPAGQLDVRLLEGIAHGFEYGVVGLLELPSPPVADGYVLVGDCNAFWLRAQSEADELESKLGLFGDTVPDAVPIKVGAQLFVARESATSIGNGELDLGDAPRPLGAPLPVADARSEQALSTLQSLAGAASMARHRCLDRGLGIEVLAKLLDCRAARDSGYGRAASFVLGVMEGVMQAVAQEARASDDELLVIAEASELVSCMSPSDGIEPNAFSRVLLERVTGAGNEGAVAIVTAFRETISKLSDNQLELTAARIDDSGQIGLRALMVFLLAPNPDQSLRWISARKEVGAGVSILTATFSGLFAGLGSVPRQVKAPDRTVFLATVAYAQSLLNGVPEIAIEHRWTEDGVEHHAMAVSGTPFAKVQGQPSPTITSFLDASRSAGLDANVHSDTGAITVGRPGVDAGRAAVATSSGSRWLKAGPVAVMSLHLRHAGKGQCPRELLERLLDPGMAPVSATLGDAPAQVILSAEVLVHDANCGHLVDEALTVLYAKAEGLGLSFPPQASGRKRAPRKKTQGKNPGLAG